MPWKTQFLAVVAFLRCGCCVRPGSFRVRTRIRSNLVSVAMVTRLLCFATCWGPALWSLSSVVSSCSSKNLGLDLLILRNLLGHISGNLQSKMFPAYFMVVSVSAATSVAAFGYVHLWTPARSAPSVEKYMLGFLLTVLGFFLSNLLVFTPMNIEVTLRKM